MSAYALPGLFPPIEGISLYTNEIIQTSTETVNWKETSSSGCGGNCSTSGPSSPSVPLHKMETKHTSSTIHPSRINVLGDAVKASVGKLSHMLISGDALPNSSSCSSHHPLPGIAVTEAKIDPVRLVQCVTSSSNQQKKLGGKTLRKRGSRERLDVPTMHHNSSKSEDNHNSNNNPHDEAIEFELSISFNGRKYTAKRTMQTIVKLRNDLIREMNSRRRWLQNTVTTASNTTSTPERQSSSSSSSSLSSSSSMKEEDVFEIPEIPPLTGDHHNSKGGGNFVGRGFSMLHAMATSYVPVMESWLRNVLTIVPQDSQCLLDFLWEPMNDMPELEAGFPSSLSLSGLDSIKELDYNTGDDDDDDDDMDDEWVC